MNAKIERQFKQIDSKLNALLSNLQQYSNEKLSYKPSPEQWSVLQVLQHLMLVENASEKYLRKKLSFNPKLSKTNLGTAWRMLLLRSYNWLPIKLKAPSYVNENNFKEQVSLSDLAAKWTEQRQQLRDYLATLPEDIYDKEVYKHPLVGRLSLQGMLQFYEGHFDRHYKQIKRLLEVA